MEFEYRKSVLGIIFNEKNEFLLIEENTKNKDYGFIQGGIEKNETEEEAIKRELKEEINLINFDIIKKCDYQNQYNYPKEIQKKHKIKGQIQTVFLIKTKQHNNLKTNEEILKIMWFKKNEFIQKLPYENLKKTANEALKEMEELK